jgi:uncharacterized repeat protein (TIGR03833 family)
MSNNNREKIISGMQVLIVMKKDQRTGKLTKGTVKDILTKSQTHPHGIKVRLESGEVGRIKEIFGGLPITLLSNCTNSKNDIR